MKSKELSGKELLDICNKVGWQKVYNLLLKEHKQLEELQAHYFGDPSTESLAQNLSVKLLRQEKTLIVMKNQARGMGIELIG